MSKPVNSRQTTATTLVKLRSASRASRANQQAMQSHSEPNKNADGDETSPKSRLHLQSRRRPYGRASGAWLLAAATATATAAIHATWSSISQLGALFEATDAISKTLSPTPDQHASGGLILFAQAKGVAGLGKAGGDNSGSDKGGQRVFGQVPLEVYNALTYAGTAFLFTLSVPLILFGLNKLLNKIEDCFGCGSSARRKRIKMMNANARATAQAANGPGAAAKISSGGDSGDLFATKLHNAHHHANSHNSECQPSGNKSDFQTQLPLYTSNTSQQTNDVATATAASAAQSAAAAAMAVAETLQGATGALGQHDISSQFSNSLTNQQQNHLLNFSLHHSSHQNTFTNDSTNSTLPTGSDYQPTTSSPAMLQPLMQPIHVGQPQQNILQQQHHQSPSYQQPYIISSPHV